MTGLFELNKIKKDVEDIINHSQDYPFNAIVDDLIQDWAKAKENFLKAFDGKTFYKSLKRISITLSEEEKKKRVSSLIKDLKLRGLLTPELRIFLENNSVGIFCNRVIMPIVEKNIPSGMKLSKSLNRFFDDKDELRQAQDMVSVITQENVISGYLYLSVDPRDFLTLSENRHNWRSCHSLDGCYRAGNLSYMADSTTIIAYLAEDGFEHYNALPPDMKWTNKKWRMLVHMNENCAYFSRPYPFESGQLEKIVLDTINEVMRIEFFSDYPLFSFSQIEGRKLLCNHVSFYGEVVSIKSLINEDDYNGYNDLASSIIAPRIFVNAYKPRMDLEGLSLKIGGPTRCMKCGENNISRCHRLLCDDCLFEAGDEDFFTSCPTCGRRIYPNMNSVIFDEQEFCSQRCANEY